MDSSTIFLRLQISIYRMKILFITLLEKDPAIRVINAKNHL